jgi:hypothetical protein
MMSKAVSVQRPQSTTRSMDSVHVPLLSAGTELLDADGLSGSADPRFFHSRLVQQVFTAAGEVEEAEWALDQVLQDGMSHDEIGVGLDVAPVDGALESARWALDQAVSALHAEIRRAARHGVSACALADAAAMDVVDVQALLDEVVVAEPARAVPGELAAAG